jgi:hypothetical protein
MYNRKSKFFGGLAFGCVSLMVVIFLATSKDVVNKVQSKAASVEPRIIAIENNQTKLYEVTLSLLSIIDTLSRDMVITTPPIGAISLDSQISIQKKKLLELIKE